MEDMVDGWLVVVVVGAEGLTVLAALAALCHHAS